MDRIETKRNDFHKELVSEIRKAVEEAGGTICLGLDNEVLVPNHDINLQDEYSRYVPLYCTVKGNDLELVCYVKEYSYQQFEDCETENVTVCGTEYDYYSMLFANYIYDYIKEKLSNGYKL